MTMLFIVAFVAIPDDAVITIPFIGAIGALQRRTRRDVRPGDLPDRRRGHPLGQEADDRRRGGPAAPRDEVPDADDRARPPRHLRGRQGAVRLRAATRSSAARCSAPWRCSRSRSSCLLRDLWVPPPGSRARPARCCSTRCGRPACGSSPTSPTSPVKADGLPVGGLVNAVPGGPAGGRGGGGQPQRPRQGRDHRGPHGRPTRSVASRARAGTTTASCAFSKICTHVGCPISLYQQRTHQLLCPCHQSTFDLADSGNVVFGPAARRMPQLPISVDDEGYLVAAATSRNPSDRASGSAA